MNLKKIFNVFSRRHKDDDLNELPAIHEEFRNRILMLLKERLSNTFHGNFLHDFWLETHKKLTMLLGRGVLAENVESQNEAEDTIHFLLNCSDKHFIDFLEYIFKSKYHWKAVNDDNEIVENINELFQYSNLPYYLTEFSFTFSKEESFGQIRNVRSISAYPQVILRENEIIHQSAMKPALSLLDNKHFELANNEFLEALEDYRNGDYGDCLTKCGSSFESVMKVICERNNWEYKDRDTAGPLLNIIFENSDLERFYNDPLIIISTLRNRFSKSHGAGVKEKSPNKNVAQFCINTTASAIIFLIKKLY